MNTGRRRKWAAPVCGAMLLLASCSSPEGDGDLTVTYVDDGAAVEEVITLEHEVTCTDLPNTKQAFTHEEGVSDEDLSFFVNFGKENANGAVTVRFGDEYFRASQAEFSFDGDTLVFGEVPGVVMARMEVAEDDQVLDREARLSGTVQCTGEVKTFS